VKNPFKTPKRTLGNPISLERARTPEGWLEFLIEVYYSIGGLKADVNINRALLLIVLAGLAGLYFRG